MAASTCSRIARTCANRMPLCYRARQSRGSRAHVNKGKPAGTKRLAVTGNDRSRTFQLQLNNLLLN